MAYSGIRCFHDDEIELLAKNAYPFQSDEEMEAMLKHLEDCYVCSGKLQNRDWLDEQNRRKRR